MRELVGTTAITDYGKVTANKIIVATHFPFLNKHGSFFAKLYQHRSYVIALENAPNVDGMYVDEAQTLTLQFMAFSIICYAILKPVIQFILSHFPTFIASPISPRRNTAEVPP